MTRFRLKSKPMRQQKTIDRFTYIEYSPIHRSDEALNKLVALEAFRKKGKEQN